jgi:hypothetical protein
MKVFLKTILFSLSFFFLSSIQYVFAYDLAIPFLGTRSINTPFEYIQMIYYFALSAGILLATTVIVVSGIRFTVSESIGNKKDARDHIIKAILGLALLLSAVLILQIIDPEIPTDSIVLPQLPPPPPAPTVKSAPFRAPPPSQPAPTDPQNPIPTGLTAKLNEKTGFVEVGYEGGPQNSVIQMAIMDENGEPIGGKWNNSGKFNHKTKKWDFLVIKSAGANYAFRACPKISTGIDESNCSFVTYP